MDQTNFEELVMAAAENPAPKTLNPLLEAIRSSGGSCPGDSLKLLFENLDEENLDPTQAQFCMELAAVPIADSAAFRLLLASAVKLLLPPYLDRTPVLRALGLRDAAVPLNHIVVRYRKLNAIKNGTIVFINSSGRWGVIGAIDNITGSVAVNPLGRNGSSAAVPLELILVSGIILAPGLDTIKLADSSGRSVMSGSEFRDIATRRALMPLTEQHMQQMARAGLASKLSPEEFEKWWSSSSASACPAASGKRRACDGRSLQEIVLLLDGDGPDKKLDASEAAAFGAFFVRMRPELAVSESKKLAEVLTRVSDQAGDEQLKEIMSPLMAKAPFWPDDPLRCNCACLAVWSELAAKDIEKLSRITAAVFPDEYLAGLAMRLPLKALNSFGAETPLDELDFLMEKQRNFSSDLAAWVWKNRSKSASAKQLLRHLSVDNIIRALSQENLPKAWTSGMRELRKLLLDSAEFQKFLVSSEDALKVAAALQGALFLSSGERQSLVVKLSRHSQTMREHIESGAGEKILRAGTSEREQRKQEKDNEPDFHVTGSRSHKALVKELNDIINIHRPENREALKVARAHGDFRENAEFDAAKERRNFLNRRQHELERELQLLQALDMRTVKVEGYVVVGSEVVLEDASGARESHYLLGAWDGDPDKRYLSYKTRLGAALIGRGKGEKIMIPGDREVVIAEIKPLPEEVLADLD